MAVHCTLGPETSARVDQEDVQQPADLHHGERSVRRKWTTGRQDAQGLLHKLYQ